MIPLHHGQEVTVRMASTSTRHAAVIEGAPWREGDREFVRVKIFTRIGQPAVVLTVQTGLVKLKGK